MHRTTSVFILLALGLSVVKVVFFTASNADQDITSQIDYMVLGLLISPLVSAFRRAPANLRTAFAGFLLAVLLSEAVAVALGGVFSYQSLVKLLISLSTLALLVVFPKFENKFRLMVLVAFWIVLAYAASLTLTNSVAVQISDAALEARHTVGYAVFAAAIGIIFGTKSAVIRLLVALLGAYISIRLQVLTALIGGGVTLTLLYSFRLGLRNTRFLATLPIFASMALYLREGDQIQNLSLTVVKEWGSGRVGAWLDGISTFMNRPFLSQLFGAGSDTTLGFWGVWWWSQKDIHSDLLKIALEFGLLSLGFFFVLIVVSWRTLQLNNPLGLSILIGATTTSLLSNGLLERPYLALIWASTALVSVADFTPRVPNTSQSAKP